MRKVVTVSVNTFRQYTQQIKKALVVTVSVSKGMYDKKTHRQLAICMMMSRYMKTVK